MAGQGVLIILNSIWIQVGKIGGSFIDRIQLEKIAGQPDLIIMNSIGIQSEKIGGSFIDRIPRFLKKKKIS